MATYKRGFKKQNTETILLKIIVGIILAVFGFVALALVYDATTEWKSYDSYTLITQYDGITEYTNGGDQALQDYVVYFYSDTCTNCKAIKNDALRAGNKLNKDAEQFFLANVDSMDDKDTNLDSFLDSVGLTSVSNQPNTFGTPALLVVVNGEVYDVYVGSTSVTQALDDLVNGNVDGFGE